MEPGAVQPCRGRAGRQDCQPRTGNDNARARPAEEGRCESSYSYPAVASCVGTFSCDRTGLADADRRGAAQVGGAAPQGQPNVDETPPRCITELDVPLARVSDERAIVHYSPFIAY